MSISQRLAVSATFGLFAGLAEGLGLFLFHAHAWVNPVQTGGVTAAILWISAIVNLCLFLALGLILGAVRKFVPSVAPLWVATCLFTFVAVYDWVGLTGRINWLGTVSVAVGLAVVASRYFRPRESQIAAAVRRLLPLMAVLALAVFVAVQGSSWYRERARAAAVAAPRPGLPNIVVVVVDTLRADHLSAYGYARHTSPHLDQIASQGVLFENAIAVAPWTLPSHASMLTGAYPHDHGADWYQPLSTRYQTLPQLLAGLGYRSAGISANVEFFCHRTGLQRGFVHFEDYDYSLGDAISRTYWGRVLSTRYLAEILGKVELPARRPAADVNRSALRWVDQDRNKPFLLFLNYFDLHDPYVFPAGYEHRFDSRVSHGSCSPSFLQRLNPMGDREEVHRLTRMPAPCFQREVDAYDASIAYLDDQIAALLGGLKARGLGTNTLLVITSDHGEAFREHGLVVHGGSLYREVIHVPLIYWWPGKIPAGVRIARPVSNGSLAATIFALLGDSAAPRFGIPSVASLWQHPDTVSDYPAPLSETSRNRALKPIFPAYKSALHSMVDEQWHVIVPRNLPAEVYSWSADPEETHNLAKTTEGQQLVNDFRAALSRQQSSPSHANNSNPAEPPSPQSQISFIQEKMQ